MRSSSKEDKGESWAALATSPLSASVSAGAGGLLLGLAVLAYFLFLGQLMSPSSTTFEFAMIRSTFRAPFGSGRYNCLAEQLEKDIGAGCESDAWSAAAIVFHNTSKSDDGGQTHELERATVRARASPWSSTSSWSSTPPGPPASPP